MHAKLKGHAVRYYLTAFRIGSILHQIVIIDEEEFFSTEEVMALIDKVVAKTK